MTVPFLRHATATLFALSTAATAGTLSVSESASYAAPPAQVWSTIGRFGALDWHPAVAATEITAGEDNARGAVRRITTQDGAVIVEELLARDAHSLRYRILDSPLPVSGYVSTLSVTAEGSGSRVTWHSDFDRKAEATDEQAREAIAGIYRAGFDGLRAVLGEAGK